MLVKVFKEEEGDSITFDKSGSNSNGNNELKTKCCTTTRFLKTSASYILSIPELIFDHLGTV